MCPYLAPPAIAMSLPDDHSGLEVCKSTHDADEKKAMACEDSPIARSDIEDDGELENTTKVLSPRLMGASRSS